MQDSTTDSQRDGADSSPESYGQDSKADACAAVFLIILTVCAVVFWVSSR